jgi:hypothetical protein
MPEEPADCRQTLELLSDYLNLELPPEACREIENHLAGCHPCEEFAQSLRHTVELCRRYQPQELPPPISERARAELLAAYEKMMRSRTSPPAASREED